MEQSYTQISSDERCEIARLRAAGFSIRKIAATLDRSPSTIAREIMRNGSSRGVYQPIYADQRSHARRWTGSMLDRDPVLREIVLIRLKLGWSPEQIAMRLAREYGTHIISGETIYRFVFAQITRHKDYSWRRYLRRGKSKRGRRSRSKRLSSAVFIAHRRSISERPIEVNDRLTLEHWEADFMQFGRTGMAILALHERHSRLLIAVPMTSKAAEPVAKVMMNILGTLPSPMRQTVTFDNGTEFASHYELNGLGIKTYFCNTYSPWQKGGIENAIGRMRLFLPRKTKLADISEDRLIEIFQIYNNTPRKCLDFRTPAELIWEKLLHFKCESSFPPPRD